MSNLLIYIIECLLFSITESTGIRNRNNEEEEKLKKMPYNINKEIHLYKLQKIQHRTSKNSNNTIMMMKKPKKEQHKAEKTTTNICNTKHFC